MATGKEIKQIYGAMLKICKETGKLIATVNDMLVDKGFRPVGNNSVMWDLSTSYLEPASWLPYFQQRIFIKGNCVSKGIGINVIFDGGILANEIPFVSCGLIDMSDGQPVSKNDDFYYAGWHGEKIRELANKVFYQTDYPERCKILNYFLPLDVLTGPGKVDELIIRPLVLLYDGRRFHANDLVKGNVITVDIIKGQGKI